ncbi:MAG: hypothetical protein HYZ14_02910 [Bacteroidetes bacterium]|nr:hypothetical protein [Bacteroidota bacterium]
MKFIFFYFVLVFFIPFKSYGQMVFSDPVEMNLYDWNYVGSTKDFSVYVVKKALGLGAEQLTYLKVFTSTGKLEVFEPEQSKMGDGNGSLLGSCIVDGELMEVYSVVLKAFTTKCYIYVAKRNIETFNLTEKKLIREQTVFNSETLPELKVFGDSQGIYMVGQDQGNADGDYIKRIDSSLEERWSENHAAFYPKERSAVQQIFNDSLNHNLIYVLNLKNCDDCGFFDREKQVTDSKTGIIIYGVNGEKKVFVPEFKEGLIYSNSKYFFNALDSTLVGLYTTHELGKSVYDEAKGLGVTMYKWNLVTGEIQNFSTKKITYGDILSSGGNDFLAALLPKAKYDANALYPRLRTTPSLSVTYGAVHYKLQNNSYLIGHYGLAGQYEDPYRNEKVNEIFENCWYFVCLDETGEQKWTLLHDHLPGEISKIIGITAKNEMVIAFKAKRTNYPDGNYQLSGSKGDTDIFGYSLVDLNTGKVISRQQVADVDERRFCDFMIWNREAERGIISLEGYKTLTSGKDRLQFGVLNPGQ